MELKLPKEHFSPSQHISILLHVNFCNEWWKPFFLSWCDYCFVYRVTVLWTFRVNSLYCLISSSITVCQWAWCCDQCYQVTTVQEVSRHYHPQKGSPSDALVPETKTEEGKHVSYWRQVITRVLLMEGSGKVGMHLIRS